MTSSSTKEELLKEVSRLYPGHSVTAPQLKRWVALGLLPPPEAGKSRGRGLGIPQMWNPVCIPMIGLIIASYREFKPNLDEAARRIFAQGFALRGDLIRKYLDEIPDRLEMNLTRQRPFMKSRKSLSLKTAKLKESVERRHRKDQPNTEDDPMNWIDALSNVIVGTARLTIAQSAYEQLGRFLSPIELRRAFHKVSDEDLPKIFFKSQDEFSSFGFVTRSITNLLREHGWSNAVEPILPTTHSNSNTYELIFEFRRSALMWGVLINVHGQQFAQVLQEVISQQFGQAVENMISLDELEPPND